MTAFGTFFLPGPTEVRPEVLAAMQGPMLPHRGAAFEALFARIQGHLRPVFRTARPVYVATASATGLMEGAIRCAPSGAVLALVNGAFSERFAQIAEACGRPVTRVGGEWHRAVPLDAVEAALRTGRYAAVTVVHSETSTGVLTPLPPLAQLARAHGARLLVDSVTGLGGAPVETDAWGLDFVLTGSQKALALPPGLAFGVASADYIRDAAAVPGRGLYFDLVEYEEAVHKHQTPNTPALSLLYATDVQGAHLAAETVEARWARHAAMAAATHAWVGTLRDATGAPFCIYAPAGERSPTVTAVALPPGVAGGEVVRDVARAGFTIGDGYGRLKGRTIRIGHMGDHTMEGLSRCLAAVGDALRARLAAGG
ncbi:MAG: aminotransferase class V-fold PLP-dependent enzyme [Gemmatimonadetes bacterium]|nr:aminotransferase class V-fold PLP-dependent enzyme [Gemmatimonadota bacterium]